MLITQPAPPLRVWISLPVLAFQILMQPSWLPVAIRVPSGLNRTDKMPWL
jgi:hypothetical protein